MKKLTAIITVMTLMVTSMVFSIVTGAEASDFEVTNGEIVEYIGSDSDVIIPSEIDGVTITGIKNYAFQDNQSLTSVTLPETITKIGKNAFRGCEGLKAINLSNVTSIGENAFYGCVNLKTVNIENAEEIGYTAFRGCSELTDIGSLNASVEELNSVFGECYNLKSVTVKGMDTDIEGAFEEIEDFVIHGYIGSKAESYAHLNKIPFYDIDSGKLVTKEWVIDSEGKLIYYNGTDTDITFPSAADNTSITGIAETAFKGNTNITSVVISEGVTSMDDSAFYGCENLKTVTIPNTITSLPFEAFAVCTSLERVDIPPEVTEFGANAFMDCPNVKIYGETGSEAEKYASDNNISFVSTGVYDETAYNVTLTLAKNVSIPEGGISVTVYSGKYRRRSGGGAAWWGHDDDSYPSNILAWEIPEESDWHKRYARVDITESKEITFTRIDQTVSIRLKNPQNINGCVGYIVNSDDYIGTGGIVLGNTRTSASLEIECSPKTQINGIITVPVSVDETVFTVYAEGNKTISKDFDGYYNSGNEFSTQTTVMIPAGDTTASYSLDVVSGKDYTVTALANDGIYIIQSKEIKHTEKGKVPLNFDNFREPNALYVSPKLPDSISELMVTSGEAATDVSGTVFIQNANEPYEVIDSVDFQIPSDGADIPEVTLKNITNASEVIASYVLWYYGDGELCGVYDNGSYFGDGNCINDAGNAAKLQVKNQRITMTFAECLPFKVTLGKESENTLTITSKTDGDINSTIYIAYYDENGLLTSIERDNAPVGAGVTKNKTLTPDEAAFGAADTVKVFIWDGCEPLSKTITLK